MVVILSFCDNEALKSDLITANPCQWVKLPQIVHREPTFYSAEQVERLLLSLTDEPLFYLLVKITATYGLRRSEVLGLRWNSVNFVNDTLQIAHTVVKVNKTVYKDKTKNASSFRTFPLILEIKQLLSAEYERSKQTVRSLEKNILTVHIYLFWKMENRILPIMSADISESP